MRRNRSTAQIDLELLTSVAPFILATDENMVLTWASRAVLKRVQGAIGMNVSELIECVDPPEEVSSELIAKKIGELRKFILYERKSMISLIGRWLSSHNGFLLLATPDPKTTEDLSLFSFDDFSQEDRLVELMTVQDEARISLQDAASAVRLFKERNMHLEKSKQELNEKVNEINKQRRAILNMLSDIEESRRQLESINASLENEITERKQAEEALKESEERYRGLFENSTDFVYTIDLEGNFTNVNQAGEHLIGYTKAELIGMNFRDYTPSDAHEGIFQAFNRVVKTGKPLQDFPIEAIVKDGRRKYFETSVVPLMKGKYIIGFHGTSRDITQRKQAEEALREYSVRLEEMVEERTKELSEAQEKLIRQEKLSVLGQLAGGLGHELRNPLGAIKNAIYLLNMVLENPEAEVKETLEIIEKEVGTSERVITSLLDFARPKPPTRNVVDVNDLVQAAMSRIPVPENVELVEELSETLPSISADPDQLSQVFGNFALNAIQAMPEGGRLVVKSEASSPAEWVIVSFTDTGVGMDEETMRKVLEPLFTTKSKGIGLGLALTNMLVEAHGGTIEIESAVGKGSIFTVKLPVE